MKQYKFDFLMCGIAYIAAMVAKSHFCSVLFAISSILFAIDAFVGWFRGE